MYSCLAVSRIAETSKWITYKTRFLHEHDRDLFIAGSHLTIFDNREYEWEVVSSPDGVVRQMNNTFSDSPEAALRVARNSISSPLSAVHYPEPLPHDTPILERETLHPGW